VFRQSQKGNRTGMVRNIDKKKKKAIKGPRKAEKKKRLKENRGANMARKMGTRFKKKKKKQKKKQNQPPPDNLAIKGPKALKISCTTKHKTPLGSKSLKKLPKNQNEIKQERKNKRQKGGRRE